jgi:membrane protease YdiL (CAAX protease family)
MDAWFVVLWFLFSLVPLYNLGMALAGADLWGAVTGFAAFVGAFGLAYALRSMRRSVSGTGGSQWVLYFLAAAIVGLLPLIPALVLPQFLHMRINGQVSTTAVPSLMTILQVGLPRFLSGTIGFVVEEVFFRGCLDTYLHRGEKGTGWLSAIYISALWGLWHLPTAALLTGNLLGTVLSLLFSQIIIGVPLSLLWRKTGNLAVPDTTHAFLEAVRSILAA